MKLNVSDFRPYYSTVNLPVNGYRDSLDGTVYEYANGDLNAREGALRTLRDAQLAVIASLIEDDLITEDGPFDLKTLQAAYAAQE